MVVTVTEQLREESQRADENERRAKEAILRYKAINDARIAAQQEAARVNEELRLYKLQLENAQREIFKAQEVLDSVEVQRYDAEASAARARSTARKIKEARLIDLAREQGRRMGMQEGMTRGQELGYHRGRSGDYRARGTPGPYPPLDFDDVQSFDSGLDPIEEPILNFASPDEDDDHVSPPRVSPPRVSPSRVPQVPATPPPVVVRPPDGEIRPVPVRNASPLRHPASIIPMDGFIPHADADSHIRLPPPHEMQRAPPTPEASPSPNLPQDLPQDDVPLMVPNPGSRHGYPSLEEIRHQRRQRRPGSPESQGSTTISQFELVSEPNGSTYRPSRNRSSRALSVIPESTSGGTSPAAGSRSVAGDPSRPPSASPSGRGGVSTVSQSGLIL
ncbi:hypothetical protein EWM64_g6396 [Hericium alpestre]|uniref:Uncharacterized protein n=1 Tax=Hericium alpestre TaxID=135208 RepID=A0A4Y9ZVV7_9AGAM|nr:hypothetical protein EWM64_g6396 [Hericium alpestre]